MSSTKLRKVGNSQGVIIPAAVLTDVGITVDDELDVYASNGTLVIQRVTREYDDAMAAHRETVAAYRDALTELAK